MDSEAAIAAQVAARAEEPEVVVEEAPKPIEVLDGDPDALKDPEIQIDAALAKTRLMEFFDVPGWARSDPQLDQRLTAILEWARSETPTQAWGDILQVINNQVTVLGIRNRDERMRRLWQFTVIRGQRKQLEEREKALYG